MANPCSGDEDDGFSLGAFAAARLRLQCGNGLLVERQLVCCLIFFHFTIFKMYKCIARRGAGTGAYTSTTVVVWQGGMNITNTLPGPGPEIVSTVKALASLPDLFCPLPSAAIACLLSDNLLTTCSFFMFFVIDVDNTWLVKMRLTFGQWPPALFPLFSILLHQNTLTRRNVYKVVYK
jgi:hypothetical protein